MHGSCVLQRPPATPHPASRAHAHPLRAPPCLPAAALGGVNPAPPQLDVAALRLSAAAPLLAAPDAPLLGGQRAPTDGVKLLQHIFGGQLPACRQPKRHARA